MFEFITLVQNLFYLFLIIIHLESSKSGVTLKVSQLIFFLQYFCCSKGWIWLTYCSFYNIILILNFFLLNSKYTHEQTTQHTAHTDQFNNNFVAQFSYYEYKRSVSVSILSISLFFDQNFLFVILRISFCINWNQNL